MYKYTVFRNTVYLTGPVDDHNFAKKKKDLAGSGLSALKSDLTKPAISDIFNYKESPLFLIFSEYFHLLAKKPVLYFYDLDVSFILCH